MNEKVENLVLEQLRLIRGDFSKPADELRGIKVEIIVRRHHQHDLELTQDGHHDDIVSIKVRIDRIERRLELVDQP